ncbi:hypothetical protein NBO_420gi001 [Nosema bombycis CQ1]|uniref:Uncharacterized protein n=1 Tax=Nosema bombycis (strain CQ1 / CVCC 102059) TaxID=578461 RepID=R0KQN0_NOSB1|nr:hypothetical protein NBO_420gi001 [Nosema bombycis CQ1]|eukprot:EOB12512.1 hypothetical protein NBO_420gi001 [Nosema bombycis CQ1]
MVLLEKKIIKSHDNLKTCSYLYLKNEYEILLFECPSIMYGSNFRPSTFESPQKKLKFKIPRLENVDRIFVSSSESLGILFLKQDIDIYITLPVYEQILSNYYSLLKLQLTYENEEFTDEKCTDEKCIDVKCIDEIDLDRLKRNIRFTTYNELIHINDITIECKPSGMFIGWCTFLYKTSSKIFHITNKVTNKKKYAIEYKDIKADFEVNLNCLKQPPNPIEKFNEKVLSVKDKSLIIACDIPTLGIELMFHLLFVFKNVPLKVPFCVKYEKFNEYFNNLCNHTEWMGQVIKTNPILSNFTIIEDIHDVKKPSIVFIDSSYVYELNSDNYEILTVGEMVLLSKRVHTQGRGSWRGKKEKITKKNKTKIKKTFNLIEI